MTAMEEVKEYYGSDIEEPVRVNVTITHDDGSYEYKEWHDNGQLREHTCYDATGAYHGEYNYWYDDGAVRIRSTFVYGAQHGDYCTWFRNGVQQLQSTYIYDELDGVYIERNESGQLLTYTHYRKGELHGEQKRWDTDGVLYHHFIYRDGKNITAHALRYVNDPVMFALVAGVPLCKI